MGLRQHYRHITRYKEIANVLTSHGVGYLIDQMGLQELLQSGRNREGNQGDFNRLMPAERLRRALEELGPTFVKLGQLLSTRPDLLPPDYILELELLQDQVNPCPFKTIADIIDEEFDSPWQELFDSIDPKPLAAASIGQVHAGILKTGEKVVLKVQRPGVSRVIRTDLEILFNIARFLEARTSWGKYYKLMDFAEEFARTMKEETDYTAEGRNADRFRANFTGNAHVYIPAVFWEYSTSRVLVMEYVNYTKITDFKGQQEAGYDIKLVARRFANSLFKQIYIDGFYHADPHPGNIGVMPGEVILYLDFGMVGRLDEQLKDKFVDAVLAIVRKDIKGVTDLLFELGDIPSGADRKALRRELERLFAKYYEIPMRQLEIGQVLGDLLRLAYSYRIRIPVEITALVKSLVTMEGILTQLDPDLSVVELAEPFGKVLLKNRFSPGKLKKIVTEEGLGLFNLTRNFPKRLDNILAMVEEGELKLELEHRNLTKFSHRLNIISNRLAFSIIVAAVIIGTSLITARSEKSLLLKIPIAEMGFLISLVMGLWLIVSIIRSGRL